MECSAAGGSVVAWRDPLRAVCGAATVLHELHLLPHQPHCQGPGQVPKLHVSRLQIFPQGGHTFVDGRHRMLTENGRGPRVLSSASSAESAHLPGLTASAWLCMVNHDIRKDCQSTGRACAMCQVLQNLTVHKSLCLRVWDASSLQSRM